MLTHTHTQREHDTDVAHVVVQYCPSGIPVITRVAKQRSEDGQHKVLTCEAEGAPQPVVLWSVNGTDVSVCGT